MSKVSKVMLTEEHVSGSVGIGVTVPASAFRACQSLATVTLNVPGLQSLQQKQARAPVQSGVCVELSGPCQETPRAEASGTSHAGQARRSDRCPTLVLQKAEWKRSCIPNEAGVTRAYRKPDSRAHAGAPRRTRTRFLLRPFPRTAGDAAAPLLCSWFSPLPSAVSAFQPLPRTCRAEKGQEGGESSSNSANRTTEISAVVWILQNALRILQRSTCFVELYCEIEDICH